MSEQDYEQLTLFPGDSPASRSPLPGSAEARKMTVISGRKCFASYERLARCGCLAKMCLESSIWHSTRCYLTWKAKITKSSRLLFRLAVSMPHTSGSVLPLWPTPSTGAALCGGTGNLQQLRKLALEGRLTAEEVKNLSSGGGGNTNPALIEWLMGYEQMFTRLIPTPTATDWKGGAAHRFAGGVLPFSVKGAGGTHAPGADWPNEPGIPRICDGVPDRVDRIRALGNAVVPHQFYPFFRAIAEIEGEKQCGE